LNKEVEKGNMKTILATLSSSLNIPSFSQDMTKDALGNYNAPSARMNER
jgi:hypothetical protein